MRVVLVATACVLGGCLEIPRPSCPEGGDADGDGWECYGTYGDCDDGDPTRNPGLVEICDDGIDQDCNGADVGCTPQLEGVTLTGPPSDETVWQVTTETTQVQLDPGASWVVSSLRLRDAAEQLLYGGPSPERELGLAVYPQFHRRDAEGETPVVRERGAARVDLDVEWEDDTYGSGVTHLAFSPDGRIFRNEVMQFPGYTHTAAEMYFSTFASFDLERFDTVDWTTNPNPPRALATLSNGAAFMGDPTDSGWMCLSSASGRRVAMAWLNVDGARGPRVTHAVVPRYVGFEYDWRRDAMSIPEVEVSSVTLFHVDELAAAGAEPCAELDEQVFTQPAALVFVTGAPGPDDEDNDGFLETEGLYEIDNAGGDDHVEVELTDGALDGGITFRVRLDATHGIMVFRDDVRLFAGTHYLIQPLEDDPGVLVYFPPGLLASEDRLRFALPGGEP